MLLKNIICHQLIADPASGKAQLQTANAELTLPNDTAHSVVDSTRKSHSRDTGLVAAAFVDGWFPQTLKQLIEEDISFAVFSEQALDRLSTQLADEPIELFGHLLLTRYSDQNSDFLMLAVLGNVDGHAIENGEIKATKHLDLKKLVFSVRVNITGWLGQKETCINFLKGAGRNAIADYLKEFLCIDDQQLVEPKKNTQQLVSAIKDYCVQNVTEDEEHSEIFQRTSTEFYERLDNEEDVLLHDIAELVVPQAAQQFVDFVANENYDIQAEFTPARSPIRALTKFTGRNKAISISFDQRALQNNEVIFERDSGRLIINKPPTSLVSALNKARHENKE